MSAAAARRRKQLAAAQSVGGDAVTRQLESILEQPDPLEESTAYEALQLAQSQVRKKITAGEVSGGLELCYSTALTLLEKGRVSVASQLLTLLADSLKETNTVETDQMIQWVVKLQNAHVAAMERTAADLTPQEITRLQRLQRDWLLRVLQWSADYGTTKLGNVILQREAGQHCWKLSNLEGADEFYEKDEVMELKCDAVQHMSLAEQPMEILQWLKSLPAPTAEETRMGHQCPPALRDALLTRAILTMAAFENLRDANILLRAYVKEVEERNIQDLAVSYTSKEDGKAPSHTMFASMLLRILEKDARTGPLYSWLMRSFKRELDGLYKPQTVHSLTTKIGKVYFNIQPPPNMLNMIENMMGMMGGGAGGMNPAMMQAMAAQMQQSGMM